MKPMLAALGCALALSASAAELSVRDDSGHTVTLPAPARRVVALAPNLAELAFAAGGGAHVVGVMRYSDFPPEAQALPVVGDAHALNYEQIVQLKPDLVLVWRSGLNDRARQRLRALKLPVYESEITSVDGIAATLKTLGTLMGTTPAAEAAAANMQSRWHALQQQYAQRPAVRVFYQLWHEPLMTVNRRHLIQQAITACGGTNPFADLPALVPTLSWEAAVQANPQLVVTGAARDEPAHLEAWQRFTQVDAVRMHRLVVLDGHALARMTPRFVDGAQALCEAIDATRRNAPGQAATHTPPASTQRQP